MEALWRKLHIRLSTFLNGLKHTTVSFFHLFRRAMMPEFMHTHLYIAAIEDTFLENSGYQAFKMASPFL